MRLLLLLCYLSLPPFFLLHRLMHAVCPLSSVSNNSNNTKKKKKKAYGEAAFTFIIIAAGFRT